MSGWLSSNKSEIGPDWNDWYDVATGGASVGRYVTPHLKTELRLAFSGEGRVFHEERIDVPGQPFPAFRLREHHFRATTLGGAVTYQFFQNQWFHPHVAAGLEVVREADRTFAPESRLPSRQPGVPLLDSRGRGRHDCLLGGQTRRRHRLQVVRQRTRLRANRRPRVDRGQAGDTRRVDCRHWSGPMKSIRHIRRHRLPGRAACAGAGRRHRRAVARVRRKS